DSRQRYEKEYLRRAANLDKCMSDLWRMERTRDKNARDMKENMMLLHTEMQAFVSESQQAAELEEKRRYRFLAEKHHLLSNTFLQFYTRSRGIIQNKSPLWKEQLEASRNPVPILLSTPHSPGLPSGRLTPTHHEMFGLGDIVIVLIPEAQNGWLYGRLEGTSTSGWFPEAFVKPLEEVREPEETTPRPFPLRSSHSVDELMDRPSTPSTGDYWHTTPSRPQSPSPSPALAVAGSRRSSVANTAATTSDNSKKPTGREHPPELFPRGTNPFATVKLRPTVTNDRSAPVIR
ncbi:UNVERIFIED_CONTAM: hypothetical protein K2H54_074664, partial [Gekko kuhli]